MVPSPRQVRRADLGYCAFPGLRQCRDSRPRQAQGHRARLPAAPGPGHQLPALLPAALQLEQGRDRQAGRADRGQAARGRVHPRGERPVSRAAQRDRGPGLGWLHQRRLRQRHESGQGEGGRAQQGQKFGARRAVGRCCSGLHRAGREVAGERRGVGGEEGRAVGVVRGPRQVLLPVGRTGEGFPGYDERDPSCLRRSAACFRAASGNNGMHLMIIINLFVTIYRKSWENYAVELINMAGVCIIKDI